MASEDAVKVAKAGSSGPAPVSDVSKIQNLQNLWGLDENQAANMLALHRQQYSIYSDPTLTYDQKIKALDQNVNDIYDITGGSPAFGGRRVFNGGDVYGRLDAEAHGIDLSPESRPYEGPSFGHFYDFGPGASADGASADGGDGYISSYGGDGYISSYGDDGYISSYGDDETVNGDYYSNLINQMAGDDRSNQTKGIQYAANVGNTVTDAEDFGTVNIFEEPPIKNETFDKLEKQNEDASNVLNSIGEGLDAYEAAASKSANDRTVPVPANSGMAAVEDGARLAASRGLLQPYLDSNPNYFLSIGRDIMPQLQATDRAAQARIATGGATLTRPVIAQTTSSKEQSQSNTGSVIDSIISAADAAGKSLSSSLGSVVDAGESAGNVIGDVASGVVDAGKSVGNVIGGVASGVVDAGKSVGNVIGDVANNIVDAGKSLVTGAETKPTDMSATGYDKNEKEGRLWSDLPFGTGSPIGIDPEPRWNISSPTTVATLATSTTNPYYGFSSKGLQSTPYGITDYIQSNAPLKTVAPVDFSKYSFPTQPQMVTANQSVKDVYPLFNTST